MNATLPFQRLVWKEYRALRQLWALCGFGGTLLMLVILAVGESSKNSAGYSAAFWAFTVWVPPVYVLAALATMFAGEREEGTLVWLTALAPRLPSVFFSRILFVLISGIGLQAWYAIVAASLSQFDDSHFASVDTEENLRIMSFLMLESLAYGLFWSLQTNRPLNAILYGAVMIILVNSGAAVLVDFLGGRFSIRPDDAADYALSFWGWARGLMVLMVMTANWFLASEWLLGNPWDWEWVAHWWSHRRVKRALGTTTVVPVLPADTVEPWRRSWQRLRWLEWQGLRSFAWLVLAMMLASCGSILIQVDRQPPHFGFSVLICGLAILLAGLVAWHGEQAQQRFRALVRLGVAPLALWLNKLACWTLAAISAVMVITAATALFWSVLALSSHNNSYRDINESIRHSIAMPGFWETVPLFVMASVTMFVVSFVAAHLCRRTVIAFGAALIGSTLTMAWFVICGQYGFPVLFFFSPIPFWLLWISAGALPAWWTEQTRWRIGGRRAAELIGQTLAPAVLLASAAGYRVWEVPTVPAVDPTYSSVSQINALRIGNTQGVKETWSELSFHLNKLLVIPDDIQFPVDQPRQFYGSLEHVIDNATNKAAARRSLVNANRETIDAISKEVVSIQSILVGWPRLDEGRQWSGAYGPLVLYAAQQALDDGNHGASLHYLQAAVRLTGMNLRYTMLPGRLDPKLLAEMIRWAQHPAQTEETLTRGLATCAQELPFWQPQPEELYLLQQYEQDQAKQVYWPWERARATKLANVAYSNRLLYLISCRSHQMRPGHTATTSQILPWLGGTRNAGDPALRAWKYVPPENRYRFNYDQPQVYGLEQALTLINFDQENQFRATLARMGVVGYRRLHGSLPLSLHDVESYFGGAAPAMYDVWTGGHFGYAPTGFPVKEPEFAPTSVFRQPLLWTAESVRYSVNVRDNTIYRWTDARGFMSYAVIRSGDASEMGWIFPIPPADPKPETTTEPKPEVKPEPEAKPDAE